MNKLSEVRNKITDFVNNSKEYRHLAVFVAALYPFFQYYSNNIAEATSWQQFLFISGLCFVLPQMVLWFWAYCKKLKIFKPIKERGLSILNVVIFFGLIGFLVLNLNKKMLLLTLIVATILGFFLVKYLKKIMIIQLIVATTSMVSLVPKLLFQLRHDNATWAKLSEEELNTKLLKTPNIFVIQPDGYANFSEMNQPPYSFDNSGFEAWLSASGFINYRGFRSNYHSTNISNSSMFAMQHHFYSNTKPETLKTYDANEVIIGKYNNVLKILKHNKYRSHLITDNSYFLIDRKTSYYDYCNIDSNFISYHNSGAVKGADIIADLTKVLDTLSATNSFFFIEKTLPSHIAYYKSDTKGKENERLDYLHRVGLANEWIKSLINKINKFDKQALIIIVADHGGYVSLDSASEIPDRKMTQVEAQSIFSSLLSIKWPKDCNSVDINYKSNVNLFRKVFYTLSGNEDLLNNSKDNSSFLPLKEKGKTNYYRYIDNVGNFVFENISD
ncbi:sulfatase-like hydrolase/transferase [Winogradskyella forsetii]|uniref:sulfatase-like hydrolase/transferase n=1 Tax=Winogradskyella forsetii TaxID=2686077 RepID=UPI0015BDEBF4|nr:sulfatase-like hydrolase/transferase [Winogradskyella forsetii]